MVNVPPLISAGDRRAGARLAGELRQLAASSSRPLRSTSRTTGTTQAAGRVGGEADVVVALEHELLAVERGVQVGEASFSARRCGLDAASATIVTLTSCCSAFSCLRNASSSVMSASSLWVTWGILHPVAREVRARELLDRG